MRFTAQNGPSASSLSCSQRPSISRLGVPYVTSRAMGVPFSSGSGGEDLAEGQVEEGAGLLGGEAALDAVVVEALQLEEGVDGGHHRPALLGREVGQLGPEVALQLPAQLRLGPVEAVLDDRVAVTGDLGGAGGGADQLVQGQPPGDEPGDAVLQASLPEV